jgi:hypothetical protein
MRLRVLSEAECYARCYGGRDEETVVVLRREGRGEQQEPLERPADSPTREAEGREAA